MFEIAEAETAELGGDRHAEDAEVAEALRDRSATDTPSVDAPGTPEPVDDSDIPSSSPARKRSP